MYRFFHERVQNRMVNNNAIGIIGQIADEFYKTIASWSLYLNNYETSFKVSEPQLERQ